MKVKSSLIKKTSSQASRHEGHKDCNGKSFEELCVEALKAAQLRITQPRLAVIQCLAKHDIPLSPKDIFGKLAAEKVKIDKVSVYRVLEALAHIKLIHQILPSGNYLRCDTACESKSSHLILTCLQCGLVKEVDLGLSFIEAIFASVASNHQFLGERHNIQIDGYCKKCRLS